VAERVELFPGIAEFFFKTPLYVWAEFQEDGPGMKSFAMSSRRRSSTQTSLAASGADVFIAEAGRDGELSRPGNGAGVIVVPVRTDGGCMLAT